MNERLRSIAQSLLLMLLSSIMPSNWAQEVSIPDPGLKGAILELLQKPAGPLTQEDLLRLTFLNASQRGIQSIEGLEAARNLTALNLTGNQLTSLTLLAGLTNLANLVL